MADKIFISLGSNLGNKQDNLAQAQLFIEQSCGNILQKSNIYRSPPWGYQSFNNYLNQVVEIVSDLDPQKLLDTLLDIEKNMGRIRSDAGYQDRAIDLDILFYDELIIKNDQLQIPHPKMHQRKFILLPMNDIASSFAHPKLKQTIFHLLEVCADQTEVTVYE